MCYPTRSDTNQAVQSQKQAKSLKFRIEEELELYYPCSENKGQGSSCNSPYGVRFYITAQYGGCRYNTFKERVILVFKKLF